MDGRADRNTRPRREDGKENGSARKGIEKGARGKKLRFFPAKKRSPMPTKPATPTPKKYITLNEVAETYGVSTRTVLRYLAEGRLKGYRVGPKLIRFNADEVERALVGER